MIQILVVGQTPPPHVGQFIMIEKMLQGTYQRLQLHHVRMAFSSSVAEIGQFQFGKMRHLFEVIYHIWVVWWYHRPDILYYPPAGPHLIPICRDIIILLTTRWLFPHVVFHFHAGGISERYGHLPMPLRALAWLAYSRASVGIRLAPENPPDSTFFLQQDAIIPYGIDDQYPRFALQKTNNPPEILFVGMLRESKGVFVLLDACRLLHEQGVSLHLKLVGDFASSQVKTDLYNFLTTHQLASIVTITGVLTGDAKWQAYAKSDIFCFPTYYEAETFGLVAVEAMQFSLPVVTTCWRGLSSIVVDGQTGYLVPPQDSHDLAEKLAYLLSHPALAQKMGQRGRERYLTHYTSEIFCQRIEALFCQVVEGE